MGILVIMPSGIGWTDLVRYVITITEELKKTTNICIVFIFYKNWLDNKQILET